MPGQLRVYLGAAPGVGKTYKMLEEGHRRLERGTDVVVGFVGDPRPPAHRGAGRRPGSRCRGRPSPTGARRSPRWTSTPCWPGAPRSRWSTNSRTPTLPVAKHEKRWQDVEELLDAGITVITTVNIQHLESLNDVVQQITGIAQRETVPDAVVRQADQIELVDMTPEALRRRMAHGNIYAPDKVDAALGNYFRVGNLTALRELALLWLADKVDEQLDRYRADHGIGDTWETRERVVVALTGGPEGDTLIRRAARIAARTKGADLLAVHVARGDGLAGGDPTHLARAARPRRETSAAPTTRWSAPTCPTALLEFARGVNATQLVLGASRRGRLAQLFSPGVGVTTTAESGSIDVHLVTHEEVAQLRRRPGRTRSALSPGRRIAGFALAALGLPLLTLLLLAVGDAVSLPTDILAFLVTVVAVALVGGLAPALFAARARLPAAQLLLHAAGPPVHHRRAGEPARPAGLPPRRLRRQRRRRPRRPPHPGSSPGAGGGGDPVHPRRQRAARPAPAAGPARAGSGDLQSRLRHSAGARGPDRPRTRGRTQRPHAGGSSTAPAGLPAGRRPRAMRKSTSTTRSPSCFAAIPWTRPTGACSRRSPPRPPSRCGRSGWLPRPPRSALSPRSTGCGPRCSTRSATTCARRWPPPKRPSGACVSNDVTFDEADRRELLATADESLDRLTALVENLLDMSRLQAGALAMARSSIDVGDVIAGALVAVGPSAHDVAIRILNATPDVWADPALLERALANLIANAIRFSPPGRPPLVTASAHEGRVEFRVIDTGPGVPAEDWDTIFLPFQRLGDRDNTTGVGLGLALSRGLVEAMGGALVPEHTPGGGLTMTVSLPAAPCARPPHEAGSASETDGQMASVVDGPDQQSGER